MKRRLLILALMVSLMTAALTAAALAQDQDIPENLEDQPIVCTEGVDCPGDPGYVPLPGEPPLDPDPPTDVNLEQPGVAPPPPEGELPPGAGVFPPYSPRSGPPEEKAPNSGGSQVESGGKSSESSSSKSSSSKSSSSKSSSGGSQKTKAKELPRTGGTVGASLLALGAGTVLVGGGLLARRLARH